MVPIDTYIEVVSTAVLVFGAIVLYFGKLINDERGDLVPEQMDFYMDGILFVVYYILGPLPLAVIMNLIFGSQIAGASLEISQSISIPFFFAAFSFICLYLVMCLYLLRYIVERDTTLKQNRIILKLKQNVIFLKGLIRKYPQGPIFLASLVILSIIIPLLFASLSPSLMEGNLALSGYDIVSLLVGSIILFAIYSLLAVEYARLTSIFPQVDVVIDGRRSIVKGTLHKIDHDFVYIKTARGSDKLINKDKVININLPKGLIK